MSNISNIVNLILEGHSFKEAKMLNETYGLQIKVYGYNDTGFGININGTDYTYSSEVYSNEELFFKFMKLTTFSVGKALAWLKKDTTFVKKKISGNVSTTTSFGSSADKAKIQKALEKEHL